MPHFLEEYYGEIESAIIESFKAVGAQFTKLPYFRSSTEASTEKLPGIYLEATFAGDSRAHEFSYLESDCLNWKAFLDDLNTDIGITVIDHLYSIYSKLSFPPGIQGYRYNISLHKDLFRGWPGLSRFWNAETAVFNWDEFNKFVAEKNAQISQTRSSGFRSATVAVPVEKTGAQALAFAPITAALRAKYASQTQPDTEMAELLAKSLATTLGTMPTTTSAATTTHPPVDPPSSLQPKHH